MNWPAYSAAVEEVRARYAGRLVIRIGVEFDFRRAYGPEMGEVLATMPMDFRIGSVHSAGGIRIYHLSRHPDAELDIRAAMAEYFDEVQALADSGLCHALGHFDYFYQQMPERAAKERDAWYWRKVEGILRQCIARGVALEANTHHMLDGLAMAADGEILRRYHALGGRLVTVGSDAHRVTDVAHGFAQAEAALCEAGFQTVTGFAGGRPYAVALR
jgi:histidinol-phosphatase (PHP family)